MQRMKKIASGTGKVILALLTGVSLPVLIWVALGMAMHKKAHEMKHKQTPVPTVAEVMIKAGLTIQEETVPRHCWEVLNCPPERQETCPVQARHDIPYWAAVGLGRRDN